jgi:hypothetical protein
MGCSGSKDPATAMTAPKNAKFRVAIVGISNEFDLSEKDAKGQRFDSVPIANGIIKNGMACDLIEVRNRVTARLAAIT